MGGWAAEQPPALDRVYPLSFQGHHVDGAGSWRDGLLGEDMNWLGGDRGQSVARLAALRAAEPFLSS